MPPQALTIKCKYCDAEFKLNNRKMIGQRKKCPKCSKRIVLTPVGAEADDLFDDFADESLDFGDGFEEEDFGEFDAVPTLPSRSTRGPKKKKKRKDDWDEEDLDRPSRASKKKKPKKQEKSNALLIVGIFLISFCLFGVIGYFGYQALPAGGSFSSKFEMPTEFDTFRKRKSRFQFQYPKGWDCSGSSLKAKLSHGSILVTYSDSIAGNLMGDIGGSNAIISDDGDPLNDQYKVDGPHITNVRKVHDEYSEYQEVDKGRLPKMPTSSRYAEFTYSTFFGKKKGYRVTMLNSRFQLNIMMECNEEEFEEVKPLFDRILSTTSINTGKGL